MHVRRNIVLALFGFLALFLVVCLGPFRARAQDAIVGFTALFVRPIPVAQLSPASFQANLIRVVSDGQNLSDCTVGGGSTLVLCISNGSAWVGLAGSGGATPAGSGSEIQYRASGSSFGAVIGSSFNSGTGTLNVSNTLNAGPNNRASLSEGTGVQSGRGLIQLTDPGGDSPGFYSGGPNLWTSITWNAGGLQLYTQGGVQLGGGNAAPTCSSSTAGLQWYVPGGSGVGDIFEICMKGSANTYSWVAVKQGP